MPDSTLAVAEATRSMPEPLVRLGPEQSARPEALCRPLIERRRSTKAAAEKPQESAAEGRSPPKPTMPTAARKTLKAASAATMRTKPQALSPSHRSPRASRRRRPHREDSAAGPRTRFHSKSARILLHCRCNQRHSTDCEGTSALRSRRSIHPCSSDSMHRSRGIRALHSPPLRESRAGSDQRELPDRGTMRVV